MSDDHDEIGPDATMELAGGFRLQPNPAVELALAVPFTDAQLAALQRIAAERDITIVDAVQCLVDEALANRNAA